MGDFKSYGIKRTARDILKRTLENDNILKCSFSTGYELFRAFEWAEYYEGTKSLMGKWLRLLEWECTTCPEEPEHGRSECHAWSALPIFEMIRVIAGLRMGEEGWNSVKICPHLQYIEKVFGKAVTPKGMVEFSFDKGKGVYCVKLPEGTNGKMILDSKTMELEGGKTYEINDCR